MRELAKENPDAARLVSQKLNDMQNEADSVQRVPLHRSLAGYFKKRAGDYRIVYRVDDKNRIITVYAIGNRKDIYRNLEKKLS